MKNLVTVGMLLASLVLFVSCNDTTKAEETALSEKPAETAPAKKTKPKPDFSMVPTNEEFPMKTVATQMDISVCGIGRGTNQMLAVRDARQNLISHSVLILNGLSFKYVQKENTIYSSAIAVNVDTSGARPTEKKLIPLGGEWLGIETMRYFKKKINLPVESECYTFSYNYDADMYTKYDMKTISRAIDEAVQMKYGKENQTDIEAVGKIYLSDFIVTEKTGGADIQLTYKVYIK